VKSIIERNSSPFSVYAVEEAAPRRGEVRY
jgi:hypothetical protein